jgi:16S rRNA (cytosine967-C5)-methyltransferase
VQDEGSQLVALALAEAPLEGRDERWLDLCAGPGGKAALLAALAAGRGARLVANEPQPHRAELVRGSLAGADGVAEVTSHDGREGPWPPGSFDRVLVDAPCSGLGALRRRPEARWRKQPSDVVGLVPLQRALLERALDLVRPGGVVVYATCSPVVAETTGVVDAVLAARDDVAPDPVTRQLWPHEHGTDAMFWATLTRRG